ncbi:MAG: hypothetical protein Q9160_006287 [Pyrenula sp. 1 TL-2023]
MKLSLVLLTTSLACFGSAAPVKDINEVGTNVLDQAEEGVMLRRKRDEDLDHLVPLYPNMRRDQASSNAVDKDSNAASISNLREDNVDASQVQKFSRDLFRETGDEMNQLDQSLSKSSSVVSRRGSADVDRNTDTLATEGFNEDDLETSDDASQTSNKLKSPFFKGDWALTSRNQDGEAKQSNRRNMDTQGAKDNQDQRDHVIQMSHEDYMNHLAGMGLGSRAEEQVNTQDQAFAKTNQEQQQSQTSKDDSSSQVTRRGQATTDRDNRMDRADGTDHFDRMDQVDRSDRADTSARADRVDQTDSSNRQNQADRSNQMDQTDSSNRQNQDDRSNQVDQTNRADRDSRVNEQQR